jgi:histidyl-tRNA synthetase
VPFEGLRGFRDYTPPEAGARSELRRRMRAVARRAGFTELETPSVESLELFRVKSGDEIGEELWSFSDKGGRPVTLIAETTPSLARIFVDRAKSEPLPVKWFSMSKLWRYEEPQAGRTREFSQLNLDILGAPGPEAEAEVLSTAAQVLEEVGATGLYAFRLNDRQLAESLGTSLGATDTGRYFRALDRYRKLSSDEFHRELAAAGLDGPSIARLQGHLQMAGSGVPIGSAGPFLERLTEGGLSEPGLAGIHRLERLFVLLELIGLGDRVVLDPTVVRGLAYYTSTVFEAYDVSGDLRALFGGGRYDNLIELFGGPATPACGLAIGDQTMELLLKVHDRWPSGEPPIDTYVIAVTPAQQDEAIRWVSRLRQAGIPTDWDLMGRSLSRQLREAARRKARRALILGPQEAARGRVVERDLTTGSQRELSPDEVLPPA